MGMRLGERIARREWLARAGMVTAGLSGLVLGLQGRTRIGAVTPAQAAEGTDDRAAHRVNLGFVSAWVVARGNQAVLVDTGIAGSEGAIGEVVQAAGLTWDQINDVILTHHHPDHQGSLEAVLARATNARVWAGPADIPNIRSGGREVLAAEDGADLFGLLVVATPGHTAGHISLLDPQLGALITGDAIVNVGGNLAGSPPMFTANMEQARESVRKMAGLSFERALFMHGDPIEQGGATAFQRLAAGM
jgi:glyoxylase-like metal-dependent hydrolase (beta-lactamase superfamily II)